MASVSLSLPQNWIIYDRPNISFDLTGTFSSWPGTPVFSGVWQHNASIKITDSIGSTIYQSFNVNWSTTSSTFTGTRTFNITILGGGAGVFTINQSLRVYIGDSDYNPGTFATFTARTASINYNGYATNQNTPWASTTAIRTYSAPNGYYKISNSWINQADGTSVPENYPWVPSSNSTYYNTTNVLNLQPNIAKSTYFITFDRNGGTGGYIDDETYQIQPYGQSRRIYHATRTGWTLTGYTITVNNTNGLPTLTNTTEYVSISIPTNVYGNFTVRANWSFNFEGNSFAIAPNAGAGTTIESNEISYSASGTSSFSVYPNIRVVEGYEVNSLQFSLTRLGNFGGPTPTISNYGPEYFNKILTIPAGSWGGINVNSSATPINYSITYNLMGGINGANPTTYNIQSFTITLLPATRVGYTFVGWFNAETSGTQITSITSGSTGNIELWAYWTAIDYTITYNTAGSAAYPTSGLHGNPTSYNIEDEIITFVQGNLVRPGWTFNSWSPSTIIEGSTGNQSTTASWNTIEYTISLNANTGIGFAINNNKYSSSQNNGVSITRTLTQPTRPGWTFNNYTITRTGTNGGSTPAIGGNTITIPSGSYGPFTTNANWTGNTSNTYTFSGAVIPSGSWTTSESSQQKLFTIPTKTGYKLPVATITAQSTGVNSSVINDSYDGTLTISANAYSSITTTISYTPITYSIIYNGNDSTSGSTLTSIHTYDTSKNITSNGFIKTGYTFAGWNTAANGSGISYSNAQSVINLTSVDNAEIILYAQWTPNSLTVLYVRDIGEGTDDYFQSGVYSGTITTKVNTFTKTGWSFTNYLNSDTTADITAPEENTTYGVPELSTEIDNGPATIILTAQWSINQYTVYFENDNDLTADITQDYDTSIDKPTDPLINGYTLENWYYDSAFTNVVTWPIVVGASNITLYAKFNGNSYNITFNENGGTEVTNRTYNTSPSGQQITLIPGTKTIDGFIIEFNRWEITTQTSGANSSIIGNILTIPANAYGNIEIEAIWGIATRKIYLGGVELAAQKIKAGSQDVNKIIYIDDEGTENIIFEKDLIEEV